jgi:hypothetical protein
MVPQRIWCRLAEIMKEKGLSQQQLSARSGVDPERIRSLCDGRWHAITRDVLGKILAATGATLAELFVQLPADIWFPIRRDRRVTVHLGSTSLEARPSGLGGPTIGRSGIGTWDVRSFFKLYDYLNQSTDGGVVVQYAEHTDDLHDPRYVEELFAKGNHVILGSSIVNPIAEDAVCRAWRVTPRQRGDAAAFPFEFLWDRAKDSAFGRAGGNGETGIVAAGGAVVARRTVIAAGENGEDCGMILAYRHNPRTRGRDSFDDDDSIIIAIMGYSGCGTLAGTELLCTDAAACALYPEHRGVGTLRAFRVQYRRAEASNYDNREIVSYALV